MSTLHNNHDYTINNEYPYIFIQWLFISLNSDVVEWKYHLDDGLPHCTTGCSPSVLISAWCLSGDYDISAGGDRSRRSTAMVMESWKF